MNKIKPIPATPTLSGKDARDIIAQVEKRPTKEAIRYNEKLLEAFKSIMK